MEQKSKQNFNEVFRLNYKYINYNLGSAIRGRKWVENWGEVAVWKPS